MKLAEALILRADCQKRFEQLKARIIRDAKIQEGDQPAENPGDLIAELERVARELADLIKRINKTNSTTAYDDSGITSLPFSSDRAAAVSQLEMQFPRPTLTKQTGQRVVVTFTLPFTLVTLLGITCYAGIEPAGRAPLRVASEAAHRRYPTFPVGGFRARSLFIRLPTAFHLSLRLRSAS